MLVPVTLPPGRARLVTKPCDGITALFHHNGDRARRLHGGRHSGDAAGDDDIHLETDEVGRPRVEGVALPRGRAELEKDVLALHPAQLKQRLAERVHWW